MLCRSSYIVLPEFGPAACHSIVLLGDEPGLGCFTAEAEQLELARDVDEWVPFPVTSVLLLQRVQHTQSYP